jgi:alanyl-tRNA synthetase
MAGEKGLSINWEGFEAELEKQRERARVGGVSVTLHVPDITIEIPPVIEWNIQVTTPIGEFVGYEIMSCGALILGLRVKGELVDTASRDEEVDIILDRTPFYGEMGGQVGDIGEISGDKGKVAITNSIRLSSDVIVNRGRVVEGSISVGDEVEAKVDSARRLDIARNHTATHLLQAALRQTLGDRVYQKGSLVETERFRFDFSHLAPITQEQLSEIQRQVNEWIRRNFKAEAKVLPYKQAINEGAIALFEEKYGEKVRMLEIGEPAISKELCGGTHVGSTGEIGVFLVTGESSIGTGLHRIEAVTGRAAESLIESRLAALQGVAKEVESSLEGVPEKVRSLVSGLDAERRRVLSLERELSRKTAEGLLEQAEQVSGITVLAGKVPPLSVTVLREMGDILRDRLKSAVVVLATVYNGKPNFLAMVTPDLIARGFHAGDIVNQVAKVTGGGGGGKAGMAQAGGKDAAKIEEALKLVKGIIAGKISTSSEGKD